VPGLSLVRWWRRRGLRARVTMTAALGLVVAFVAIDLLLFNVLRVSLTRSVDDTARQGAAGVVALIDANRLPTPVPVAPDVTVQVLGTSGQIIDVSPDTDRLVPLLSPAHAATIARNGEATLLNGPAYGLPSQLRATAERASDGSLVIAAVPFSSVSSSLSVVGKALVFGTPVLFVLFTGAIWLAVGSTLRPIDLLRRGAARVTGTAAVPADLPVPEARDEVRSLALTLNDMLSRLAAAQQRQRALVSDTAHELRSPIASIRAQLEVALDHPAGQDWESTARDVHADVLRLARLAEDLLLLARLDERAGAGSGSAALGGGGTVDLAELSESVVARYAGARVPVTYSGSTDPCLVAGDWGAVDRLLVNLVDNAVRYAKSQVAVTVGREDGWGVLAVADDGPGVPDADLERVFDRFARLDDARSRDGDEGGGAGLGLAIVRATAQAYGGTALLEPGDPAAAPPGLRAVVQLPSASG